ncbi:MAG: hypothetical protein SGBAC_011295 [Bacillariaceae sp.]
MMHPYNTEKVDPEIARRRAIQQIYFDNTLSPLEKHQRILVVQGMQFQDSDSENMSIFTEGTEIVPNKGSVGSRTSNSSIKSSNSSNNSNTSRSSRSSKMSAKSPKRNSVMEAAARIEQNYLKKIVGTTANTKIEKSYKKESILPTPKSPPPAVEIKSMSNYDASVILMSSNSNSNSNSNSKKKKKRQEHQLQYPYHDDNFDQLVPPPMEEVESVVPIGTTAAANAADTATTTPSATNEDVRVEEYDDGLMKEISLHDDHDNKDGDEEPAVQSQKMILPAKKPQSSSSSSSKQGSRNQGSTGTTPIYDITSMNSSIDTQEQNKDIILNKKADDFDAQTIKTFSHRKKRACGFFCCSLFLFSAVIVPLVYFRRDLFTESLKPLTTPTTTTEDNGGLNVPTAPEMTSMPSSSPTKEYLYDPPSAQDCQDITNGSLTLKNGWILRRFQVPMDVNLQYETTDVDTMAKMLVAHLQSDLAPVLAGCHHVVGEAFLLRRRRRLDTTRFVIGNAIISGWHESDDVCAIQKSTCYRVMVEMSLYVQGTKTNNSFQDIVTDALDSSGGGGGGEESSLVSQLDLPSPFDEIIVRGVFPAFSTEAPTNVPSHSPTVPITSSPTTAPVVAATPNPTFAATAQPTIQPTPGPTNPPTPFPTDQPIDCKTTLQQVLENNGVTEIDNNAFQWMKVDQWRCNGNENSIVDRYALASLYLSLDGADQWTFKTNWMSATSVCEWQGVGCDANSIAVTALQLGGNQLSGGLPVELTLLTKLTSLDLDNNGLGSKILPELANLVELTNLNLSNNAFTGQVPDTFASLVKLESLKVDSNQMKGALTAQIGQMTKLSDLSLSEISQLTSLRSLEISSNKMKGDIPELQAMFQLTLLRLDNNKLSGDIPPLPSSLTTCNLTKNKFKGNTNNGKGVCILN